MTSMRFPLSPLAPTLPIQSNSILVVQRQAVDADICIINGGTFRADAVLGPGVLHLRDLVALLPMQDSTVKLRMRGARVLEALENSVCAWPAREGRFAQVSGLRFTFDPTQPSGSRVVRGSVMVQARRQSAATSAANVSKAVQSPASASTITAATATATKQSSPLAPISVASKAHSVSQGSGSNSIATSDVTGLLPTPQPANGTGTPVGGGADGGRTPFDIEQVEVEEGATPIVLPTPLVSPAGRMLPQLHGAASGVAAGISSSHHPSSSSEASTATADSSRSSATPSDVGSITSARSDVSASATPSAIDPAPALLPHSSSSLSVAALISPHRRLAGLIPHGYTTHIHDYDVSGGGSGTSGERGLALPPLEPCHSGNSSGGSSGGSGGQREAFTVSPAKLAADASTSSARTPAKSFTFSFGTPSSPPDDGSARASSLTPSSASGIVGTDVATALGSNDPSIVGLPLDVPFSTAVAVAAGAVVISGGAGGATYVTSYSADDDDARKASAAFTGLTLQSVTSAANGGDDVTSSRASTVDNDGASLNLSPLAAPCLSPGQTSVDSGLRIASLLPGGSPLNAGSSHHHHQQQGVGGGDKALPAVDHDSLFRVASAVDHLSDAPSLLLSSSDTGHSNASRQKEAAAGDVTGSAQLANSGATQSRRPSMMRRAESAPGELLSSGGIDHMLHDDVTALSRLSTADGEPVAAAASGSTSTSGPSISVSAGPLLPSPAPSTVSASPSDPAESVASSSSFSGGGSVGANNKAHPVSSAEPPSSSHRPPLPNPIHYEVDSKGKVVRRKDASSAATGGGGMGSPSAGIAPGSPVGGATVTSASSPSGIMSSSLWVPLDPEGWYTVATKSYLAHGKDGYTCFAAPDVEVVIGEENGPILPTIVRNHFRILSALSGIGHLDISQATSPARSHLMRPRLEGLRRVPTRHSGMAGAVISSSSTSSGEAPPHAIAAGLKPFHSPSHATSGSHQQHHNHNQHVPLSLPAYSLAIAPITDGRIAVVDGAAGLQLKN